MTPTAAFERSRTTFDRSFYGNHRAWSAPGEVFTYSFGVGFSASDDMALTAEMSGEFQSEFQFNGNAIPNTTQEPVSLRIGLTRRVSRNCSVQPFLSAGLTNDAPQLFVGVFWVRTENASDTFSWLPWKNRNRQYGADCLP